MTIEVLTILLFGSVFLVLVTGLPIAFVLGSVGVAFSLVFVGQHALFLGIYQVWHAMNNFILVAIPMFILMGITLQNSGIADDLFQVIYKWAGGIKGGLGMGTVAICAVIAAMSGVSGAATVSMGIIALPAMLKRGYDKHIAIGLIQAGGALGFLIPPSVLMVFYAYFARVSVGRLFAGGVLPGIMLATFYIIYIGVRCRLQPHMGPPIDVKERADWREKVGSLKGIALPVVLIFLVLGTIFVGVASPTEASAIGAAGAFVCAVIHKRFSWSLLKESLWHTTRLTAMVMWILFSAFTFSTMYSFLGAKAVIEGIMGGLGLGPLEMILVMQLSFFVLGCILDDGAILFLTMPLYLPIVAELGFDPTWYGILFVVNMQMAFLTPPFGYNLFYMRAIVPPGITMGDIYRSIIPFVLLQGIGLLIIVFVPQIVLWLPNLIFG